MKREFRVRRLRSRRYLDPEQFALRADGVLMKRYLWDWWMATSRYAIEFYTGFVDSDNRKIFDKDVLVDADGKRSHVSWHRGGWYVSPEGTRVFHRMADHKNTLQLED